MRERREENMKGIQHRKKQKKRERTVREVLQVVDEISIRRSEIRSWWTEMSD